MVEFVKTYTSPTLETLAAFVPSMVVRSLSNDPHILTQPTSEHIASAVLVADISGFTALTERLTQRGPVGVEEVFNILKCIHGASD